MDACQYRSVAAPIQELTFNGSVCLTNDFRMETTPRSSLLRKRLFMRVSEHNKQLEQTGCFLRFSGHPELTIQESANADTRTENDAALQ